MESPIRCKRMCAVIMLADPPNLFRPKPLYRCLASVPGTMSILDVFRQEYVQGKVMDKYRLNNGNLGLIVEDAATHRRYHVEFRDGYKGPNPENLFGLLEEPFAGKTEYLDNLVREGDNIDLTLSYSRGPFREVYYVHSVSRPNPVKTPYQSSRKLIDLPYSAGRTHGYL
jgi:hypothetical protein